MHGLSLLTEKIARKRISRERKKKSLAISVGRRPILGVVIVVAKSGYLGTKCLEVRFTWNHQALLCALVPKTSLTRLFIRHANKK